MEMQQTLHRYVANLADAKKTLMVGNDFDLLQSLAMAPLSELVIYDRESDPDAPKGETPLGAPLRFRPDWQERPRSKDLIIDFAGLMPKAEIERVLKKAGIYLTCKKRRLAGFQATALESNDVSAHFLGEFHPAPALTWVAGQESPSSRSVIAWAFGRDAVSLPSVLDVSSLMPTRSAQDEQLLGSLQEKVAAQDETLRGVRQALAASKEQINELSAEEKANARKLKASEQKLSELAELTDQLRSEKLELESENDQLSARAAELQAEENRFGRLEASFRDYQSESLREVEALQSELRALAAPADDIGRLVTERDEAKERLAHLVDAIDVLFANSFGKKKVPKMPPIGLGNKGAPLKLWLARMESLLVTQQTKISEQKSDIKTLHTSLKKAQRSARPNQKVAKGTEKARKTVRIDLVAPDDDRKAQHLSELLKIEQALRTDAESRVKMTIKRTKAMTKMFADMENELAETKELVYEEKALRTSIEADCDLLKQELTVKHDELEERGRILETYASLQGLIADSLSQAEEARLEAEDARRLADENLRILRDEFERFQHSGLVEDNSR